MDEHFGKAASIGRQMTENTVQKDGALWGMLSHSVPSAILCLNYWINSKIRGQMERDSDGNII